MSRSYSRVTTLSRAATLKPLYSIKAMDSTFRRAQHARRRAKEIRSVASGVTDPGCRRALLILASRYDRLADRLLAIEEKDAPESIRA